MSSFARPKSPSWLFPISAITMTSRLRSTEPICTLRRRLPTVIVKHVLGIDETKAERLVQPHGWCVRRLGSYFDSRGPPLIAGSIPRRETNHIASDAPPLMTCIHTNEINQKTVIRLPQ